MSDLEVRNLLLAYAEQAARLGQAAILVDTNTVISLLRAESGEQTKDDLVTGSIRDELIDVLYAAFPPHDHETHDAVTEAADAIIARFPWIAEEHEVEENNWRFTDHYRYVTPWKEAR